MHKKLVWLLFIVFTTSAWAPLTAINSFLTPTPHVSSTSSAWLHSHLKKIHAHAGNLNKEVLKASLVAYLKAQQSQLNPSHFLTIIDYSKPSTFRRLWVVDLKNDKVLFNTWVAHGKNSGNLTANSFSNEPGSLKSSIGVFLTEQAYVGGNGYSLRLLGLERGINDNAYRRDIVIHGAAYVGMRNIKLQGRLGRSWGCPAVSPKTIAPLINTIKDKSLVVVYYPDGYWLRNSTFLAAR